MEFRCRRRRGAGYGKEHRNHARPSSGSRRKARLPWSWSGSAELVSAKQLFVALDGDQYSAWLVPICYDEMIGVTRLEST